MTFDAHVHFSVLIKKSPPELESSIREKRVFCTSCHSAAELGEIDCFRGQGCRFVTSFGIHPQDPSPQLKEILADALKKGSIQAIGECGYDFWEGKDDEAFKNQRALFRFQAELAAANSMPLILHCRLGMDALFADSSLLKKVPSVIFHSWPGSPGEARAFLDRGVNMYFSFGGTLVNGKKSAVASCGSLPGERLLAETDAPWQPIGRKEFSKLSDIDEVLMKMAETRKMPVDALRELANANFIKAFGRDAHGLY